ncbi:MAG: imidazolonepropionase [Vampirovibrio sp.]|nr:imidazolonepropionase [Vampirovibrio sp.]
MSEYLVFLHANQVVTVDAKYTTAENPLGVIPNGSMVVKDGSISWVGDTRDLDLSQYSDAKQIDCIGKTLLPGFIDSHTHPVFAGDRAAEFEQRLNGVSYQDIAKAGGGILHTVEATRRASEDDLYESAKQRLRTMMSFGVTTVEAKSGYGLDWETELKSLKVIQRLKNTLPLSVIATYMGAHDIPADYRQQENGIDAYVDVLCTQDLPQLAKLGLADFVDVFCETGYFSVDQTRRILQTAKDLGFELKVHAEEFSDLGGAALAAELGAMSADHLLHINDKSITAMKESGTIATLLPGTAFYLRLSHYAPAKKILDIGVPVALATDFNPGSCMTENLQWIMTLACFQMGMTPAQVIESVTLSGAKALGLEADRGSLSPGKRADIIQLDVPGYQHLFYHVGINHLDSVWITGKKVE